MAKAHDKEKKREQSISQVRTAIANLTEFQYARIGKFATVAANRPDLRSAGIEANDLLHEALLLALTGERIWYSPQYVSFKNFLMGIIKSLVSHEATKINIRKIAASDIRKVTVRAHAIGYADVVMEARQTLERIQAALSGDREARLYMVARAKGIPFSEMPSLLPLDKKEIDAARHRVARKLQKILKTEDGYDC